MRKNKNDILTIKAQEYENATRDAENAISMFEIAVNRLKETNQRMRSSMEDIEAYCANMMAVHSSLEKSAAHNEAVIANFSKLLCVEE